MNTSREIKDAVDAIMEMRNATVGREPLVSNPSGCFLSVSADRRRREIMDRIHQERDDIVINGVFITEVPEIIPVNCHDKKQKPKSKFDENGTPLDMTAGTVHENNAGQKFEVTKYINSLHVAIKFIESGYESVAQSGNIRRGAVQDKSC